MSNIDELFSSDRSFQLWRYTVSHSQLLLRSNKTDTETKRVEVLFKGVDLVTIPTTLDGLVITENPLEALPDDEFQGVKVDSSFHRYFHIKTNKTNGVILACAVFFAEDDGDYADASKLYIDGIR